MDTDTNPVDASMIRAVPTTYQTYLSKDSRDCPNFLIFLVSARCSRLPRNYKCLILRNSLSNSWHVFGYSSTVG